ncbi:MAG: hypothetical protein JWN03_7033 [Nocardia sp.]|nr:hypothetical protein [Nocardia sp.]MCU1646758.1 hypothetical protein [Nocardia sp.]
MKGISLNVPSSNELEAEIKEEVHAAGRSYQSQMIGGCRTVLEVGYL